MTSDDDLRVVLVTAPDEPTGRELARKLVAARLAACVNILPGLTSVYRWQGAVEEDSEVLLLIKASEARRAELERWIEREHPYDVPECIHLTPAAVASGYRDWWASALAEPRGGSSASEEAPS